ncbi:MAG: peptidylprolyl isomerase [Nanoarchaeota archaeon]|nr:peptidylprolyl isomerase [Nanoarchaeota archaeon]
MVAQGSNKGEKVELQTTHGTIVVQLYKDMPITTGNFEKLVREGFYDGILFHRVDEGFVIQGGDPLSKDPSKKNLWGTGGSDSIKDEFNDASNVRGTISMANAGPNTGSSQFFINLADNIFLDGRHPVFGEVIEGMDVVDAISKVSVDSRDRPVEDVKIISAKIVG